MGRFFRKWCKSILTKNMLTIKIIRSQRLKLHSLSELFFKKIFKTLSDIRYFWNTRLSGRSQAYSVATISHRTTHYRENSSFTRTARLWNNLQADIFPTSFNISLFKANQPFLLSPPSI